MPAFVSVSQSLLVPAAAVTAAGGVVNSQGRQAGANPPAGETVLWTATHEDPTGGGSRPAESGGGTTTLKEYYSPQAGATGNYGGGEYNDSGGASNQSTDVAKSGTGSAKLVGVASGDQGIRLFRWRELQQNRVTFQEAWFYLPAAFALTHDPGTGQYCIIFQFKSKNQDGSRNDPFWYVTLDMQAGLAQRLKLWWGAQSGLAGPQSSDGVAFKSYASTVDVPVATWFRLRCELKQSKDFDGYIRVWYTPSPGGSEVLLWEVLDVRTAWPSTTPGNAWQVDQAWATCLYSDGTSPGSPVLHVDEARIWTVP